MLRLALGGVLAIGSAQAMAAAVTLCAQPYTQTLPGPTGPVAVPMWGYSLGACGAAAPSAPGPVLVVPPGDTTLTVTLQNNLSVPTSLVIAGQKLPAGGAPVRAADVVGDACTEPTTDVACRIRSFTSETAPGTSRVYTFTNLKPGSYLYQSGTHQQVQVQMGLFGLATLDAQGIGVLPRQITANPNTIIDADVPVVLSEIDTAQHTLIQNTLGSTVLATQQTWQTGKNSTFAYSPNYFLINGKPYDGTTATDLPVTTFSGGYVGLRLANAGLRSRTLVLNNGTWQLLTEDGNDYPAPREQYSVLLPAGKTVDARVIVEAPSSSLAFFDRRGGTDNAASPSASPVPASGDALGGQVARLVVSNGGPAPTNIADLAITKTDGASSVFVGDTVTYTVVVANHGPNAVVNAVVNDPLPANFTPTVAWTCVGAGGGTCGTAGVVGAISNALVSLPVNATATFTLTGTVAGSARTLTNTASVALPAGMLDRIPLNNTATDSDTVLVRTADLSITKSHSLAKVAAGGALTYTITASSGAASNVTVTSTVADTAPAGIAFGSWTCVGSNGATCPASGSGNLNAAVTLPPTGSVTFSVNATAAITAASGVRTNTASISVPTGVTDPNAGDNTATDGTGVTVVGLPTATALDAFNRANANTLNNGANWNQVTVPLLGAALRVNGNQALASVAGAAYWNTVFGAKQWAAMTVANTTFNGDALTLKTSGGASAAIPGNWVRVGLTANSVVVATSQTGGLTSTTAATLTGAAATFANGNRLTAYVDDTGLVYVWKTAGATSTYVGSAQLPNDALWTTGGGRIGLQLPAGARVDDFAGGTLP